LLDIQPRTGLNHGADRRHTATMSFNPRESARLSPATVTIHDDGNVSRQTISAQTKLGDLF
jgi:hypothetical protein